MSSMVITSVSLNVVFVNCRFAN